MPDRESPGRWPPPAEPLAARPRLTEENMRDRSPPPSELSFGDLIGDPIVRLMMKADGVNESDLLRAIGAAAAPNRPLHGRAPAIAPAGDEERGRLRRGVGIMLVDRDGRAWVGQRIDIAAEAWQMPQGGIDRGETPAMAARRELREELGTDNADIIAESRTWLSYDIPADILARLRSPCCHGQIQKWFLMRFRGRDGEIDIATEHPEFSAWKWVSPESLAELVVPFKRAVYRSVLREFQAHLPELRQRI